MASLNLEEKENFTRLSRLLVDKGTEALRITLESIHPNLPAVLNASKASLGKLKPRLINDTQWNSLFPPSGNPPDAKAFDVTLLMVLLRNICSLRSPATGWNTMPPDADRSLEANVTRIKLYRNEIYAHVSSTLVGSATFENLWQKISEALVDLNIPRKEINNLKTCPLGPKEQVWEQALKKWYLDDQECKIILDDVKERLIQSEQRRQNDMEQLSANFEQIRKGMQQFSQSKTDGEESYSEKSGVGQKHNSSVDSHLLQGLAKHNFKSKIRSKVKLFHTGTREWLLKKVDNWFNREEESRLLLITAGPGFGKSVFSAKVCELFREKGKLAACHFCDFGDSNLKDPMMMLQSLASQMCANVAGFREELLDQLKRPHEVGSLNDAFQIYLQNPLDELEAEPSLIVIDGLDESATNDRSDIVKLMENHFPELPRSVKVLVTSRSELSIQILHHIQTIKVEADDYQNEWDLSRYIEDSCKSFEMNTTSLILEKCEGSFLYAFHFQHELRKRNDLYTVEDLKNFLPKGLGSVYEMYFHRLAFELEIAMNKKPDLYKILELVVAAKKSLPLSFFARALDLDPGCREMRRIINKVNEAISCLLYISNDVVTVFHKSVYDWLLGNGYNDHEYSVKIDNGSKRLWQMCKQIFEKIKETVISGNDVKSTNEVMYTLKYGHDYLLACDMKDDFHWLVDMIVVHVCTTVVHRQHLKWNWRDALRSDKAMNLSLRKRISWHFIEFYEDTMEGENQSCSYLKSVLNHSPEGCFTTEERSIAKVILKKFCQCLNHSNNDKKSLKPLFANTFSNLSDITAVDVCPRKKLAAVALKDGTIRVLSLPELVELFQYSTGLKHIPCCKFSPDCSVLLYGKLAKALSIDEEKEILYFNGKVDTFQSCSFSPNGKRLVTSDGSKILMLWDVSRKMLVSFLFGALPLTSCSFSETGLFITGNGERHNEDSYCVWSAITFQRMDQRSFYNNNVERKDQRRRSQRCNRCFCQAHKDLIPQKEFSTKEWGNSTGIYKNVECIFHLDGQSLHVVETIHLSTLAIWGIFIEHFKCCISHYVIAAIEYNLWFYSDGCVLVVYLAVPLKESQSCLLPPTRGLWCCFSPDGSRLACFTSDGFINLWYVDTSNIYQRFRVDIGTFSAACWWSENYLFACYLKDEIPFLVQYPADENLTIMVAEMLPISLCPVVNSFLPFSKFLDFSEGYISFECDRRSPVKVIYVNEMDCPKIVCLPEIRPMMRIAVSVGGSLILGAYYSGTLIWKRSEADPAVYDILTAYGYDWPTLYSVGSCCFSDDLKNVVSFLPGEYSMALINLDSDVFVTKEIRDGDSTDMCRNRVTSENIVQFPKHQWAPAQVFCTKSVLVFVTTKLIRIFDRKSEKFLRSLFHWHLNDCSIIHSKLSPKGTVLAVPRLNGFVDFFQICDPERS